MALRPEDIVIGGNGHLADVVRIERLGAETVLHVRFRAHDLRRTAASFMGESGVDRFHIAHVLNHRSVTHSTVTAIYDRYRYDKEKRAALEKWSEILTGIVETKARGSVAR